MPNYLARVAAAGARTSTPIRPPVGAPPVMPGPGLFEPALSAEMEAEVVPPAAADTSRLLDASPAPSTPALGATPPRVPTADLPSTASPASPAVARPEGGPAAPPPPAAPSSPRMEPQQEIQRPMSVDIIRVPKSLRAAPISATPPAAAGARNSEKPPAEAPVRPPAPMPAAVRQHPVPALTERPSDLTVAAEASPATPAAAAPLPEGSPFPGGLPSSAVPMQRESAAVAASVPARRPDPGFTGLPLPPAQAGPPEPPVAAQRSSRITIGRLEVQVANHPPPPAARPSRLPSPPDRDILAGLYLDRFPLMP